MMSDPQRVARWMGSSVLDLAARWFRERAGLPRDAGAGEHAHWDPVNRRWRYHIHDQDRRPRRV